MGLKKGNLQKQQDSTCLLKNNYKPSTSALNLEKYNKPALIRNILNHKY